METYGSFTKSVGVCLWTSSVKWGTVYVKVSFVFIHT